MNHRIIFWLVIAVLLHVPLACPAEEVVPQVQQLDAVVAEALASNPELKADTARWDSFIAQARQAGAWKDPMLMLGAQNLLLREPLAFNREAMTSKLIGVSQEVPFFGKRALQREVARQDAEAARWVVAERGIELTRMVKESWYRLLFIDRSLQIVEKNISVLNDLNRLSETLYSVGQGLQQDVLKTQLERSRMEELRITLRQQRRSEETALNALRFQPAETPVTPGSPLKLTAVTLEAAQLENLAISERPLLKQIEATQQKAEAARKLAEREYYPDFTLRLEYMQREPTPDEPGYDMYSAGVTFNLPVQREPRRARVAETESGLREARAEYDAAINRIRQGIADSLARLARTEELARLYTQGILIQADQSLQAAMAAYRTGKVDLASVLESQNTLFNAERDYAEAVADHEMQLAALEAVIGAALL